MRFYRLYDVGADPAALLRAENQRSTPWGSSDHGRCDKCGGRGTVTYGCRSCMEVGAREECPACGGRVEFDDVCPACEGDGTIDRVERIGVSAFPAAEGLYRYLVECDADFAEKALLCLDGELTGDRDLDADMGSLLIIPERISGIRPIDWQLVDRMRRRFR